MMITKFPINSILPILIFGFLICFHAVAQSPDDCISCTKPVIKANLPACTPTPAFTPTPTCIPPTLDSINASNQAVQTEISATCPWKPFWGYRDGYGTNNNFFFVKIYNTWGDPTWGQNNRVNEKDICSAKKELTFSAQNLSFPVSGPSAATISVTGLPPGLQYDASSNSIKGNVSLNVPISQQKLDARKCDNQVYNACCDHSMRNSYRYLGTLNQVFPVTVTASNSCGTVSKTVNLTFTGSHKYVWAEGSSCNTVTPLSVELSGDSLDITNATESDFKLADSQKGSTLWFASAEAPLLVIDSDKKGEILDGKQLFGNWTDGKIWKNGFEALESLDLDKNKILTLSELSKVRLWFDNNKNGKSDEDEVSDLDSAGVVEIDLKQEVQTVENALYGVTIARKRGAIKFNDGKKANLTDWFVPELNKGTWEAKLKYLKDQGYNLQQYSESPKWEDNKSPIDGYLAWKTDAKGKVQGYRFGALEFEAASEESPKSYSIRAAPLTGKLEGENLDLACSFKEGDAEVDLKFKAVVKSDSIQGKSFEVVQSTEGTQNFNKKYELRMSNPVHVPSFIKN
jgi:hypothetical protein